MKAFLIQLVTFAASTALIVAAPAAESALDTTKAGLTKVKLGMTRKQVESILGPAWEPWVTGGWASGQDARYRNKAFPDYYLEIHYDWTGQHGIGRHPKPEDPVIRLPEIKPNDQVPNK